MRDLFKERPMLFNAAMVRAILSGYKTQTRRVMKVQPPTAEYKLSTCIDTTGNKRDKGRQHWITMQDQYSVDDCSQPYFSCPFGYAGDQLWVKETWRTWEGLDDVKPSNLVDGVIVDYAAGGNSVGAFLVFDVSKKWRSPLFMQKRLSRITLQITGIRVERLTDISEEDAKAEGAECLIADNVTDQEKALLDLPLYEIDNPYRNGYALLWESINGEGSWGANPWVWVIEFEVIKP